jgi:hypothetical protein
MICSMSLILIDIENYFLKYPFLFPFKNPNLHFFSPLSSIIYNLNWVEKHYANLDPLSLSKEKMSRGPMNPGSMCDGGMNMSPSDMMMHRKRML